MPPAATFTNSTRAGCLLGGIALLAVAWMGLPGCAEPIERPGMHLPPAPDQDLAQSEDAGVDVRTIQRTGQPPDGPITPAGAPGGADEPQEDPGPRAGGTTLPSPPQVFAADDRRGPFPEPAEDATAAGGYRTVGGVLAEVNGRPIFTHDLMDDAVRNELRGEARRQSDRELFLRQAQGILNRELDARIRDEVYRLVAERNLSHNDRQLALHIATQYRVSRVTAAGGSEALARQIAREETGLSLEKLVEDQERLFLFQIFLRNVILPRAIPSADDVRAYYLRHQHEFSGQGRGEIDFLLIEISAEGDSGGAATPEQARLRAEHVRRLAEAGEDFSQLAAEYNDNPLYRNNRGAIPGAPLGRGDFRWRSVDDAVWSTPEGQVTAVIAGDDGRRHFIAKVVRRVEPRAVTFEEAQRQISERITNHRRYELLDQYVREAQRYAAITPEEQRARNLRTALEVVGQQYEAWRAE